MFNNIKINPKSGTLIIYLVLTLVTLTVFGQVYKFDFINADDAIFVQENHVLSGITLHGLKWAFSTTSTTYAGFWHPLTWLSFMLDNHLYGLNAGGYHMTNLVFHILSVLLLFWLFNRVTGKIWKSAFVAAVFAVHPNQVESVAWIAERKDVLSAFFWMLTLCLYVYYTENPSIRRYLFVLFCFACALMSKSMVVTMPVIMILLDYWPLGRFQSEKTIPIRTDFEHLPENQDKQRLKITGKNQNLLKNKFRGLRHQGWFLWEKTPFFILSAGFSLTTISIWHNPLFEDFPLSIRVNNALYAFLTYLKKILLPSQIHFYHHFSYQIPILQILGAALLIMMITIVVITARKNFPYLFVGWFWYVITLLPVLGIMPYGISWIHEHYTYLPSIGISLMIGWGVPQFFQSSKISKKILLSVGIALIAILTVLAYQRCSHWENSLKLFDYAVQNTKDDYLAYNNRGAAYFTKGNYQNALDDFNKAILLAPHSQMTYNNRGVTYDVLGQYQRAIEDYNKSMQLKPDDHATYFLRGTSYYNLGQYQKAIDDYNKSLNLTSNNVQVILNRGVAYFKQGNKNLGCRDAKKACDSGRCDLLKSAKASGDCL